MRETQRVAILTTLFVGFRVGEVLALKISDLNLERQTLTVNKNLIRVPTAAISPDMQPVLISYNRNYADKIVRPENQFEIVGRVL